MASLACGKSIVVRELRSLKASTSRQPRAIINSAFTIKLVPARTSLLLRRQSLSPIPSWTCTVSPRVVAATSLAQLLHWVLVSNTGTRYLILLDSCWTLLGGTINLSGVWDIASSTSFSGVGTLDLTSALPTNGFSLSSTHADHTIKIPANGLLYATGSFSQVLLSSKSDSSRLITGVVVILWC